METIGGKRGTLTTPFDQVAHQKNSGPISHPTYTQQLLVGSCRHFIAGWLFAAGVAHSACIIVYNKLVLYYLVIWVQCMQFFPEETTKNHQREYFFICFFQLFILLDTTNGISPTKQHMYSPREGVKKGNSYSYRNCIGAWYHVFLWTSLSWVSMDIIIFREKDAKKRLFILYRATGHVWMLVTWPKHRCNSCYYPHVW